jgi:hypothetical protein
MAQRSWPPCRPCGPSFSSTRRACYLVVSAACIVLGGQAADRIGARLASMVGLALFGVASCIIATAGTQTELLAGRAMQSLAAAFAVPGTLAAVDTSAGARHDAPWCFFKKLQEMTQGKPTAPAVGDFRAVWKVDTIDIKFGVHPGCACLK